MTIRYPDLTGQKGTKTVAGYNLDGSALSGFGQITLRTFGESVSDGDLADGDQVYCTVYKDAANWATILATFNDAATDTLTSVTILSSAGTISNTDTVDIRVTQIGKWFNELESRNRWASTAGTDADTTMVVNTTPYLVDMSAWATANRTYTLPATFAVGDVVDIHVTAGNATYALIIKPAAGDDINGGTAGSELTRLFITGEKMRLRGTVANTSWIVEHDGRIPAAGCIRLTANSPTLTGGAKTEFSGLDGNGSEMAFDVGDCLDSSNGRWTTRRNGIVITAAGIWTLASETNPYILIEKDPDSTDITQSYYFNSTSALHRFNTTNVIDVATGDVVACNYSCSGDWVAVGSSGKMQTYFSVTEQL